MAGRKIGDRTIMRFPVLMFAAFALAGSTLAMEPTPDPLVGTWLLDRFTDTPDDGAPLYPFGERPVGQFIFTSEGHFSFSVMRDPPADDPRAPRDAADDFIPSWFVSYFGTYRYNPSTSSWTTKVLGANMPSYIGTEQTRSFTITGDRLTITAVYKVDGRTIRAERVLHRARR